MGATGAEPVVKLAGHYITTMTHTAPTIGATTTAALAANTDRLYALLINDSNETIYVKIGASAAMNAGIRLNANGGSFEMSLGAGNLSTAAINPKQISRRMR